jgi:hypothetical protein
VLVVAPAVDMEDPVAIERASAIKNDAGASPASSAGAAAAATMALPIFFTQSSAEHHHHHHEFAHNHTPIAAEAVESLPYLESNMTTGPGTVTTAATVNTMAHITAIPAAPLSSAGPENILDLPIRDIGILMARTVTRGHSDPERAELQAVIMAGVTNYRLTALVLCAKKPEAETLARQLLIGRDQPNLTDGVFWATVEFIERARNNELASIISNPEVST